MNDVWVLVILDHDTDMIAEMISAHASESAGVAAERFYRQFTATHQQHAKGLYTDVRKVEFGA